MLPAAARGAGDASIVVAAFGAFLAGMISVIALAWETSPFRYVVAIARARSFTRAAEHEQVAQPSVSDGA